MEGNKSPAAGMSVNVVANSSASLCSAKIRKAELYHMHS